VRPSCGKAPPPPPLREPPPEPRGRIRQVGIHRAGVSIAALLFAQAPALACSTDHELSNLQEDVDERDGESELDVDEPRLDVGSGSSSTQADGPVGIDGGPVSLPVGLSWVELDGADLADVSDGTVDVRLTNLTADTLTVLLVVERSSGIERSTDTLSTIVVDGNASTELAVELLPENVNLGEVATSMNLRIDATVVVGSGVEVSDAAALGHYQTPTLYFHAASDGDTGHRVYGEATLKSIFGAGLVDASALASGNDVVVPDGATLEGVVVGAEG